MKYRFLMIAGISIVLLTGCKTEVTDVDSSANIGITNQTKDNNLPNMGSVLPPGEYSLLVVNEELSVISNDNVLYAKVKDEYTEITDFICSYAVSNDHQIIMYTTGEADEPGELYMYHVESQENKMILGNDEGKNTPKEILWLDDKLLLVIRGFGHGRVRYGGQIDIYHRDTGKLTPLLIPEERSEYRSIKAFKKDSVIVEQAKWIDDSLNEFETETMIYKREELLSMINEK